MHDMHALCNDANSSSTPFTPYLPACLNSHTSQHIHSSTWKHGLTSTTGGTTTAATAADTDAAAGAAATSGIDPRSTTRAYSLNNQERLSAANTKTSSRAALPGRQDNAGRNTMTPNMSTTEYMHRCVGL